MARLAISRIFEVSKLLATDAGKQLADAVNYLSDLSENTIRALRQGITFRDNVNCIIPTLSLKHNTPQIVNTDLRTPAHVIVSRCMDMSVAVTIAWGMDAQGRLVVTPYMSNASPLPLDVVLLILFD